MHATATYFFLTGSFKSWLHLRHFYSHRQHSSLSAVAVIVKPQIARIARGRFNETIDDYAKDGGAGAV